ncbi:unnamed protein product [Heligmosomoides polygyrus]|uniref:C2 domain-containing protein n=1 Tax=Heligmosomoides polygyrus TaxID=6339 RepID=A0A3P8CYY3_HELPZ|nr:unnamed protein product [Heligmosomoides polygyrus]
MSHPTAIDAMDGSVMDRLGENTPQPLEDWDQLGSWKVGAKVCEVKNASNTSSGILLATRAAEATVTKSRSGHVKHLALLTTGQAPDVYVKSYIRPDPQNLTKRKTQVVKASQNPTFNREMYYENVGGEHVLSTRVLEVSVWNSAGLMDNNKLYVLYIPLQKLKNRPEDRKGNRMLEGWFSFDKNV